MNIPYDLKKTLASAFTEMDSLKGLCALRKSRVEEGMMRCDAADFMSMVCMLCDGNAQVIEGEVPAECLEHLNNGDYLVAEELQPNA